MLPMDRTCHIRLCLILLLASTCRALTVQEVENLTSTVFTGYNKDLLPLLNQSETVSIYISTNIVSLNEFDEISGILSLSLLFGMFWKEERLTWNPVDHGGKSSLVVRRCNIWRPRLFLLQAANRIEDIGNEGTDMRLSHDGTMFWGVGKVIYSTCSVDVTFFPYDEQTCILDFTDSAYTADELTYAVGSGKLILDHFTKNSEWNLLDTSGIERFTYGNGSSSSYLKMTLKFKRRTLFYEVYIFAPLFVLSILNTIVFVMPASSGERLSVAVTIFLSFVVFMDSVKQYVPESSEPMSILYYYILCLIFYSSCIMFLCVASLRIHDNNTEIPSRVVKLTRILRCCGHCKRHPLQVEPAEQRAPVERLTDQTKAHEIDGLEPIADFDDVQEEITWQIVGKTFDCICFSVLVVICVTFSAVYLVFLKTGSTA